jgi:hypothetical protein
MLGGLRARSGTAAGAESSCDEDPQVRVAGLAGSADDGTCVVSLGVLHRIGISDEKEEVMVARVATFEGVNVEAAERTIDQAGAIYEQLVEPLDGYRGSLHLFAADGKVQAIDFFDSAEQAEAAEQTFDEEMPRRLGDLFNVWEGRRLSVDRYNVLMDRRR